MGVVSWCVAFHEPHRPSFRTIGLALGAIILLAYSNSFTAGFAFDNVILRQDARFATISAGNLWNIVARNYWWPVPSREYRPLTSLTYLFNRAPAAEDPAGFHAVNFALHWVNACLVYLLVLALFARSGPAIFAAALFAVHPIGTEAVTNMVGRADLLAACAVLSALLLHVRHPGQRLRSLFLLGTAGIFAKESAVILLPAVVLYDLVYRVPAREKHGGLARIARTWWVLAAPLAIFAAVRSLVFRSLPPAWFPLLDNPLAHADFWTARITAFKVLGKSFWLLIWPAHLSADYSYNQIPLVRWPLRGWEDWQAAAALAVLLAGCGLLFRMRRTNPAVSFFGFFILVALAPTSNLLVPIGSVLGERFLYLPAAGFAACAAAAIYGICERTRLARLGPRGAPALLAVLVIAGGVRTYARNFDWQDDVHLWGAARRTAPRSFKTHKNLAQAWAAAPDPAGRIEDIIAEAETAAAIMKPLAPGDRDRDVFLSLGAYYRYKGDLLAARDPQSALPWYRKSAAALRQAVEADRAVLEVAHRRGSTQMAGDFRVYAELGLSCLRLAEPAAALEALDTARRFSPEQMLPYHLLGYAYANLGRPAEALVALHQAVLLDNTNRDALAALAESYRRAGAGACALSGRPEAPVINPDCPAVRGNLCAAYAGIARGLEEAGAVERAGTYRAAAVRSYGCAPASGFPLTGATAAQGTRMVR